MKKSNFSLHESSAKSASQEKVVIQLPKALIQLALVSRLVIVRIAVFPRGPCLIRTQQWSLEPSSNRTRSYRNSMKSLVVERILQYYRQYHMISNRILQYSGESYRMVQDHMGWVWDHRQTRKDSTAHCKILITWNHTRSYRISQIPGQNPIKSLLILVKIVQDLTQDFGRLTILRNPYQIWRRSCRIIDKILCNRTRSYRNSIEF